MNKSVGLELLGVSFSLDCATKEWARLMEVLWEPFVADDARGDVLAIAEDEGGWRTTCGWHVDLVQADPWLMANEIRHLLVEEALARSKVTAIHAAALARGERGLILVGDSGAGKTTLTFELAARGFEYLTDDLVVLGDGGRLSPFPKPLGIKEPERWEEFSHHLDDLDWPGSPNDLFLVPPRALGWKDPKEPCSVGAIVFLERGSNGEVRTETLSGGRTLADLGAFARPIDTASLSMLAAVCADAACARLVSDDPPSAAAALEDLLG